MGTQQDSINISQVQAVVLGLIPAASRAPTATTTTTIEIPNCVNSQGQIDSSASRFSQHAKNTASPRQWSVNQRQGRDAPALLTSQSHVPSSIVDSPRLKMHSDNTPSDGDTQPVSQSVYGVIKQASTGFGAPYFRGEGETGHVNLLGCLEPEAGDKEDAGALPEDDVDDDTDLVSQDGRLDPFPEFMRFQQPKTPLTQGTKRKRPNQDDTPEMQTPSLPINPFASFATTDIMKASQIFQATQAQTSPQFTHSEGLYERPSPNINAIGRPSTAGSLSSPVMARDSRLAVIRAVAEPQINYISMKESQEAREKRLQETQLEQDDVSEDGFESPSHAQAPQSVWRGASARGLPVRKPNLSKTELLPGSQSLKRADRQSSKVFLMSDDPSCQDNLGNISEDETEREEEKEEKNYADEIDELAEENKENIEVPMTISRLHHAQIMTSQSSPSCNHVRRRTRTQDAQSATEVRGSPRATKSPTGGPGSETGTQAYTVRDSQSSQQRSSNARSAVSACFRPQTSFDSRNMVLQSKSSQKSGSPIPPSSIPERSAALDTITQLASSSPLPLRRSQSRSPKTSRSRPDGSEILEAREPPRTSTHTDDVLRSSIQQPTKQPLLRNASQTVQCAISIPPNMTSSTMSKTSSLINELASVHEVIPNSSQDLSSSGPAPLPTSEAVTKKLLDAQSLRITLFETALTRLSPSPSKTQARTLQTRSQGSDRSSPSKEGQYRTLSEIAADPSPADLVEDVNLLDFGLLSKEDEEFQNIVRRRRFFEAPSRKQSSITSTTWKGSITDSSCNHHGTPTAPSSAVSALTPVRSEAESQGSSPIPPPPVSHNTGLLSPTVTKDVLGLSPDDQIIPSRGVLAPTPIRKPLTLNPQSMSSAPRFSVRGRGISVTVDQQLSRVEQAESIKSMAPQTLSRLNIDPPIVAPDRVFARFNGKQSAFYSATCLGVIPGHEPCYSVHYDDGVEDIVSSSGIKRLEFRPGDVVKVDLPAHRSRNYIVIGMQEKDAGEDPERLARRRRTNPHDKVAWPETDRYGYTKVLLSPKQRNSVHGNQTNNEQIAVGIHNLYFTQAMWKNIRDREYTHTDRNTKTLGRLQRSSDRPPTPSSPSSRAKRLKAMTLTHSISKTGPNHGLFTNMIFTLTNICQPADLKRAQSLIVANGGKVLEDGFDSLFHVPILHRIASPKKSDWDSDFHPTRQAQNLGFTCLIADKYCRRAKYIQALALGIPCLATRWISDCVLKQRILPWSAFLLPAGESTFLGGATRSRVLPPLPAETTKLTSIVEKRPRMLEGASILLIMSKNDEEVMRQHPLLTFALGPMRVARALSIEAAAKSVAEAQAVGDPWDWVFSYDRERDVERIIFGNKAKKRKSRSDGGRQEGEKTRVIGNEFLIQSLVLGQLIDE